MGKTNSEEDASPRDGMTIQIQSLRSFDVSDTISDDPVLIEL